MHLKKNFETLPLDEKHRHLFRHTLIAINEPTHCTPQSIQNLEDIGWSQTDIFDAIDHGAFLYRFSKILKAYSA
jgi:hypothetical protein